jgi:hypothetical protein
VTETRGGRGLRSGSILFFSVVVLIVVQAMQAQTGQSASNAASRLNQPRFESRIGNSVDAGTGAFILEKEIFSIQGGRDLAFNIVHNSLLSGAGGVMGIRVDPRV